MMSEKLLDIKNLAVHYASGKDTVKAVNGISFGLEKGESLGLVGETGAGKTTTALSIMGLLPPKVSEIVSGSIVLDGEELVNNPPGKVVNGEILFEGEDLLQTSQADMRKIRGAKISMIFQDPMTALNPVLTVGEQICEVIHLHQNIPRTEATQRAVQMMELVGIEGSRYNDYPHQFSGGMKQRIVIAIALACNPELLVADEPTTALDVTIQAQVLDLIEKLKADFNTSLLLITHDLGIVAEVCDKAAIMYAGRIVEYGNLEHIYNNTKHPYTVGLFGSIPNFDENVRRLKPIPGLMPDPTRLPEGCAFAPRCPHATDRCRQAPIPVVEVEPGHLVECVLFEQQGVAGA